MNDRIPCGNYEALVTYLYDECEPAERERIAAHISQCASCTEELQGLQDTRAHLGAWTPPSLSLGFQITRTEDAQPGKVLRPATFAHRDAHREAGWWRQPLPAWAQMAAAVLIFAAGMSVNPLRGGASAPAIAGGQPDAGVRPVAAASVSRADIARLDDRLRSLETAQVERASVQIPRTAAASISERELMERVQALVDARIALTEREHNERSYKVLTNVAQRVDLVEERTQYQEDALRTMMGGSLIRASFSPAQR